MNNTGRLRDCYTGIEPCVDSTFLRGGRPLKEANSDVYEDEQALRVQAEKTSGRSLSESEWALIAPDWSGPYGDLDVAEMVAAVRDALPALVKPSPDEKARAHRMAHVQRAALEARDMVEAARESIFGHKEPPFPGRGIEGAEWIEAQVQEHETKRFHIEVNVPAQLSSMESLAWLKDYLNIKLEHYLPPNSSDDSVPLKEFLVESDAVRNIGWGMPTLAYLGVNGAGEINIKRVQASDGTQLGLLQSNSEKLAKAANWEPYAAVHHLLTGGIVSHSAVQAKSRYRVGREVYGDSHLMTLEISDPTLATQQVLIAAFSKERSDNAPPWNERTQQRTRVAPKSERVAAFVERYPAKSWSERFVEWNKQNPDEHFRTESALKEAFYRANRR